MNFDEREDKLRREHHTHLYKLWKMEKVLGEVKPMIDWVAENPNSAQTKRLLDEVHKKLEALADFVEDKKRTANV